MKLKAKKFFREKWGEGFKYVTLSNGTKRLEMSMKDVYRTMEEYAKIVNQPKK